MASNKKPTIIVKVKPIIEKKRRKSDLVIMWHSICDVTVQIVFKLRLSFLDIWERARLWLWHDEIQDIQKFLEQYLPRVPDDFSNSWRDGKLLCILLNKLQPGCIPEADNLDPNYGLRNMYHAFDVMETKFGITANASVEQLVVCIDGSDLKLLEILSQLKKETENKPVIPKINVEQNELKDDKQDCCPESKQCIVKGTGLMVAFVGRAANFITCCSSMTDLNIVIEIKGPFNTICRERITKRSPKKKLSTTQLAQNETNSFFRSYSYTDKSNSTVADKSDNTENNLIPLEYSMYMNQIRVTYTPLMEGQHVISILWDGQHVSDSPYVVPVEPSVELRSLYTPKHLKSTLKLPGRKEDRENMERKKAAVKFQEPEDKIKRIGKVINRRVLRHIVKINGRDIAVESNDIDHLAAALLKMDYDFQTDPSKSRRNSWGFAGDAERKISVIRQFCVPPHEMEAQHMKLQRRSRSLTINTDAKPPPKHGTSFETEDIVQPKRLETVSEDSVSGYVQNYHEDKEQEEDMYSYLDKEFQTVAEASDVNEVESTNDTASVCNSESIDDLEENETSQSQSATTNDINEEELLSLRVNDTNEVNGNDMNAENIESPPDNLTSLSEFSVRQVTENETVCSPDIYEAIEKEIENYEKITNVHPEHERKRLSNDTKIQQNRLYYESRSYLNRNEFEGINENVRDRDEVSFERKLLEQQEDDEIPSASLIQKYPDLEKCLDTLCDVNSKQLPKEKNESNLHFEISFPTKKDIISNNIQVGRLPTYKRPRKMNFSQSNKYHQKIFESKKRCKLNNKSENNHRRPGFCKENPKKIKYAGTNDCEYFSFDQSLRQSCEAQSLKNMKLECTELELKFRNDKSEEKPFYNYQLNSFEPEDSTLFSCKYNNKDIFHNKTSTPYERKSKVSSHFEPFLFIQDIDEDSPTQLKEDEKFGLTTKVRKTINIPKNSSMENLYTQSNSAQNPSDSLNKMSPTFQSSYPHLDFEKDPSDFKSHIQEHSLVSLGQYNFKHFNPSADNSRGSLIRNKIKKLENAMVRDSQKAVFVASSRTIVPAEKVDMKAKLHFWENAYQEHKQADQGKIPEADDSVQELNDLQKEHLTPDTKQVELGDTGKPEKQNTAAEAISVREDTFDAFNHSLTLNNEEVNICRGKFTENKLDSELNSTPKSKRSFSDPGVLDPASRENVLAVLSPIVVRRQLNPTSSTDNFSSSVDADYLESSTEDGLSSADALISTEDEYIDDEIPDNSLFAYWGDLSLMKNSKVANVSKYKEYCQYIDSEILKNQYQCIKSCPTECKVFGIGTYFGYVAVKNRFRVLTKGAGNGNLSVSVQGFGKHDVGFVSVKYMHKDIYEVTYQVMRPGLYLISIRWMENNIVGSPFLCKITF